MNALMQETMDLMSGFSEIQQRFVLSIVRQVPERRITGDSYVCEYGYVHGEYNDEMKAAFEETEEIFSRIESGEHKPRYNSFADILAEIDAEI